MNSRHMSITAAAALFVATITPIRAHAAIPVIDLSSIEQLLKEVQTDAQILEQAQQQLQTLRNIPQNLIGQVQGLLNQAVANPLRGIEGDLTGLMNGTGTGNCTGSQNLLGANQLVQAIPLPIPGAAQIGQGIDFTGAMINGQATRTAGVLACNQQALNGVQQQLDQLPQLLDELQACGDVTCATAVNGRIQYQLAQGQALQTQSALVGQNAQLMQWTREQNTLQYMRGGEQDLINMTGGANAIGGGGGGAMAVAAPMTPAPTFGAGG